MCTQHRRRDGDGDGDGDGAAMIAWIQREVGDENVKRQSISAVLRLVSNGATVPFIARYRKEQTLNLDAVHIHNIMQQQQIWNDLQKR